jgi:hypothetical protein
MRSDRQPELPFRWRRLADAASFALTIHAQQTRKGTGMPYISHLLGVASLVLEHGGDEEQAIAGLLHDAVEDQGAHQAAAIAERFGPRVAAIVLGCTDADTIPKPPWRARKQRYIDHLRHADRDVLLVSCADKLHNARAICIDLHTHGQAVYDRFKGGQDGTLWYYSTLSDIFLRLLPGPLSSELAAAVSRMSRFGQGASSAEPQTPPDHVAGETLARSGASDDRMRRRHAFNENLADRCRRLARDTMDRLFDEVRAAARERESWSLSGGDPEPRDFWDEFAWMIVNDQTAFREDYNDAMRGICRLVVNRLPALEREVLERCCDSYNENWRPDQPEPDDAERSGFLVDTLFQEVYREADEHGWHLKEGEDDSDGDPPPGEADEGDA